MGINVPPPIPGSLPQAILSVRFSNSSSQVALENYGLVLKLHPHTQDC